MLTTCLTFYFGTCFGGSTRHQGSVGIFPLLLSSAIIFMSSFITIHNGNGVFALMGVPDRLKVEESDVILVQRCMM